MLLAHNNSNFNSLPHNIYTYDDFDEYDDDYEGDCIYGYEFYDNNTNFQFDFNDQNQYQFQNINNNVMHNKYHNNTSNDINYENQSYMYNNNEQCGMPFKNNVSKFDNNNFNSNVHQIHDNNINNTCKNNDDDDENDEPLLSYIIEGTDDIALAPFDIHKIKVPFRWIINGPSHCGKSTLVVNILYHISYKFDFVFLFAGTYTTITDFSKYIDPAYCYLIKTKKDLEIIKRIADEIEKLNEPYIELEGRPRYNTLFILDDVYARMGSDAAKDETLSTVFTAGRHTGLGIIVNIQKFTMTPTIIRSNATHIAQFRFQTNNDLKACAALMGNIDEALLSKIITDCDACTTEESKKVLIYDSEFPTVDLHEKLFCIETIPIKKIPHFISTSLLQRAFALFFKKDRNTVIKEREVHLDYFNKVIKNDDKGGKRFNTTGNLPKKKSKKKNITTHFISKKNK